MWPPLGGGAQGGVGVEGFIKDMNDFMFVNIAGH